MKKFYSGFSFFFGSYNLLSFDFSSSKAEQVAITFCSELERMHHFPMWEPHWRHSGTAGPDGHGKTGFQDCRLFSHRCLLVEANSSAPHTGPSQPGLQLSLPSSPQHLPPGLPTATRDSLGLPKSLGLLHSVPRQAPRLPHSLLFLEGPPQMSPPEATFHSLWAAVTPLEALDACRHSSRCRPGLWRGVCPQGQRCPSGRAHLRTAC